VKLARGSLLALVVLSLTACGGSGSQSETRIYDVMNPSMEPTLHCGRNTFTYRCRPPSQDHVIVQLTRTNLKRGDIIVFHRPHAFGVGCGTVSETTTYIKRIVGVGGDTVSYDGRHLRVNGTPESFPGRQGGTTGTWHVHKGRYFIMGDNRVVSCDSRRWGSLQKSLIVGKVVGVDRPWKGRIEVP
jgi:signal peptidase I